jgi:hypothetical protein
MRIRDTQLQAGGGTSPPLITSPPSLRLALIGNLTHESGFLRLADAREMIVIIDIYNRSTLMLIRRACISGRGRLYVAECKSSTEDT